MSDSFPIPAKYLNPWFNTGEKEALENLLSYFKDEEITTLREYLEDLIAAAVVTGVTDGDKGDITVSAGATVYTIDPDVVTYAKMQNVSATDKLLGRSSAGAGDVQEITCTAAGRALIDDADISAQRTTLGLGTAAVEAAATLLARANHTGTQTASTISDFSEAVDDRVAVLIVNGTNATATYNDGANTLTLEVPNTRRYQYCTIACSDRTTALATGTKVGRVVVPYGFTIVGVSCDLGTAQASGNIFTVDCNINGSTILSTKLTIDNTETKSQTAATAAVLSGTSISAGDELSWDIDQIGNGSALWLQCTFWGYQT